MAGGRQIARQYQRCASDQRNGLPGAEQIPQYGSDHIKVRRRHHRPIGQHVYRFPGVGGASVLPADPSTVVSPLDAGCRG